MKFLLLGLFASLIGCSGAALNPAHIGHYTFSGTVVDSNQKPVPNARVKVLGWETLTDERGQWRQEQLVECGASRETMSSHKKSEGVLVVADGFNSVDHPYEIERAAWFESCPKIRSEFSFQTVLNKTSETKSENKSGASEHEAPSSGVAL